MPDDLPDWIYQGATVGVYSQTWGYSSPRVSVKTVDRFTATQIVLDDDSRYRRDTLCAVGNNSGQLLPLTDSRILDGRALNRMRRLSKELDATLGKLDGGAEAVLAALDDAAEQVAKVRRQVAALIQEAGGA